MKKRQQGQESNGLPRDLDILENKREVEKQDGRFFKRISLLKRGKKSEQVSGKRKTNP